MTYIDEHSFLVIGHSGIRFCGLWQFCQLRLRWQYNTHDSSDTIYDGSSAKIELCSLFSVS